MTNQCWAPRSSAASNRAPYSGSEPQLFVCWLSAGICEGIVLICKANIFIRSVAVRVCSLRNLVCFFAVLVRPVTGFIRRGFIGRISTLSHRRFTLVVWISLNRQFTTSRIRRAGSRCIGPGNPNGRMRCSVIRWPNDWRASADSRLPRRCLLPRKIRGRLLLGPG